VTKTYALKYNIIKYVILYKENSMFIKEQVEDFYKFIIKRQDIYYKKTILKQAWPWTDDEVLKNYKFCNIFRQLDTGTQLIINQEFESKAEALVNIVAYRFFNRTDHFDRIGVIRLKNFNLKQYIQILEIEKQKGPISHDAYLTHGSHIHKAIRVQWIIDNSEKLLESLNNKESAEQSFKTLLQIKGVGKFLAYQIWLDASYHNLHPWNGNDYVVIGPGSKTGLDIMTENTKNQKDEWYEDAMYKLRDMQHDIYPSIGYTKYDDYKMTLDSIEHALCEWRKYYNLKDGKGKKRIYKPADAQKINKNIPLF